MNTTPTLLILGAGRGQLGLIHAARRLGYHTIVASQTHGNPPGIAAADTLLEADITNPTEVLNALGDTPIDGVATCCADTPLAALAAVTAARNLPGLTPDQAALCNDKLAMKKALARAGVPTAKYQLIHNTHDVDDAINTLGLPLVIKATDLQGSNGVYICHTAHDAHQAYPQAAAASRSGTVIAEQFLHGKEIGAQALIADGTILFVLPHDDDTLTRATEVPIGHSVPLNQPPHIHQAIDTNVRAAIAALGLDNCAVNVDIMLDGDTATIIELTGRAGANCLIEMTGPYLGIDYYELIARLALRDHVHDTYNARTPRADAVYARMLFSETTGTVDTITTPHDPHPGIDDARLYITRGDTIRSFATSNDCIGHIVATGTTPQDCLDLITQHEQATTITLT